MPFKSPEKRKEHLKKVYWKRKRIAADRLGGACVDCGETDLHKLEFDHTDPEQKSRKVSQLYSYSLKRYLAEVDKCVLRCTDCHRHKTARNGENNRWRQNGTQHEEREREEAPQHFAALDDSDDDWWE